MPSSFVHSSKSTILIGDAAPALSLAGQDHLLVRTSGSSGSPKVIRRSAASWIASFETNAALFDIKPNDIYAVLGGFETSLSLYAVTEALHLGADVLALGRMSPRAQKEALVAHEATALYATPTQLRLLTRDRSDRIKGVRYVLCGGGKLDQTTREAAESTFTNATFFEFFGSAETSFITLSDINTPEGSVGCAYPEVEIKVQDDEIWVKSPYLFDGYSEGSSKETRWENGFLSIGEMGLLDANGALFLKGRKSRMVTVADQNVFPEDIEAILSSVVSPRNVAAIPVIDALRGHHFLAVIEGESDETLAAKALDACRHALASVAVPKRVVFLEAFPLLGSGKPDLVGLERRLSQKI